MVWTHGISCSFSVMVCVRVVPKKLSWVTYVLKTWVEVIYRIKWIVIVCWCCKSSLSKLIVCSVLPWWENSSFDTEWPATYIVHLFKPILTWIITKQLTGLISSSTLLGLNYDNCILTVKYEQKVLRGSQIYWYTVLYFFCHNLCAKIYLLDT